MMYRRERSFESGRSSMLPPACDACLCPRFFDKRGGIWLYKIIMKFFKICIFEMCLSGRVSFSSSTFIFIYSGRGEAFHIACDKKDVKKENVFRKAFHIHCELKHSTYCLYIDERY